MTKLLNYGNGLRVCVVNLPIRSVMAGIWVGTGSKFETSENNGISHFTEHVMFKGTKKMSPLDIANAFEGYGAMINAFTGKEVTCYYYKSLDKYAEKCFSLLCDIFFDSVFPEDELEKERKVIVEEINMVEDAPDEICSDLISSAVYGDKSLGQTILGTKENVMRFTRDDVNAYIGKRYTSDNTVIVLAGNISEEQADKWIKKYALDRFMNSNAERVNVKNVFEKNKQRVRVKDCEQTNITLAFPSVGILHEKEIASQNVLSCLFGGGMSSRLFQSVRERQGLAYSIYTSCYGYNDAGMFTICLNNSPSNTEKALLSVKNEIKILLDKGISNEELDRAKIQIVSSLAFGEENVQSIMISNGKSILCAESVFDVNKKIEMIENVSVFDVMAFAEKTFDMNAVTAAYVGKRYDEDIIDLMKN